MTFAALLLALVMGMLTGSAVLANEEVTAGAPVFDVSVILDSPAIVAPESGASGGCGAPFTLTLAPRGASAVSLTAAGTSGEIDAGGAPATTAPRQPACAAGITS